MIDAIMSMIVETSAMSSTAVSHMINLVTFHGVFWMFIGAKIRPHSQWNLGDFFSQF